MPTVEYLVMPWPGRQTEDCQTLVLAGMIGRESAFEGLCRSYYIQVGWSAKETFDWYRSFDDLPSKSSFGQLQHAIAESRLTSHSMDRGLPAFSSVRLLLTRFLERPVEFDAGPGNLVPASLPALLLMRMGTGGTREPKPDAALMLEELAQMRCDKIGPDGLDSNLFLNAVRPILEDIQAIDADEEW